MRNKYRYLPFVVFLLLVTIFLLVLFHQQEASSGVISPAGDKTIPSGEFAFFHVRKLASPGFRGRAPGDKGADRAGRYIADQFKRIGCRPAGDGCTYFESLQEPRFVLIKEGSRWKPSVLEGEPVWSDNVLAVLGDEESPAWQTIIVSAHYDHLGTFRGNYFPGANDNASGVGVLLEIARVLAARSALPCQVIFAAWTGEEKGMYGSQYFVSRFLLDQVAAVINLDSLGTGDPEKFLIWTGEQGTPLLTMIEEVASEMNLKLEIQPLYPHSEHNSDHKVFAERGVPAVTVLSPDWLEKNHTFADTPERINPKKLENAAKLVIEIVDRLAYQRKEE